MKRGATIFVQGVILIVGIGVLALMLWEPHLEGRNKDATVFQIYFNDPFLAYAYIASIAFFMALYQAFKLLGYIRHNRVFCLDSVKALRTVKYCAISLVASIGAAEAYLVIAVRDKDDIAGGVAMGLVLILISVVIGAAAAAFERMIRSALDPKSENDLTV